MEQNQVLESLTETIKVIKTRDELDSFMRKHKKGECTIKANVYLYKDSRLEDIVFNWNGDLLFSFKEGKYLSILDWTPVYCALERYKKENLIKEYNSTWFWRIKDFSINGCLSMDKVDL